MRGRKKNKGGGRPDHHRGYRSSDVWFRKTRVGTNFLTKSVTVLDVTVAVMLEF